MVLILPLLAACGGGNNNGGQPTTPSGTGGGATAAATVPAGGTTPAPGGTAAGETPAAGTTETAGPAATGGVEETPAAGATETAGPGATEGAETPAAGETPGTQGNAGGAGDKTITIGSKNFTEEVILGELYAQALEAKGYKVNRKLNLGSVEVLDKALQTGQIDMYPEYTGTALINVAKYNGDLPNTPEKTYQLVQDFYAKRNPPMTLLKSANFNNTNAIIVTKDAADKYKLKTLEDLAKASPNLVFASFGEFQTRPDSFPNMKKNYPGFKFKDVVIVNDLGLRYKAIEEGKADAGIGFTTDAQIADQGLAVMEDTRHIWPYYLPTPILPDKYLKAHPDVEGVLNSVSAKLNEEAMRKMNAAVDIDEEEPADVADQYLKDNGLK